MTAQDPILVSVLMTAYNRQAYIQKAIESVLASAYTHFELIIVDDGSKDATVEIARSFERKDPRISVYVNERNLGDYPNRNRATTYAKGRYIMYVDSDDTLYPEVMGTCVAEMEQHPECGFGITCPPAVSPTTTILSSQEAIQKHFFEKPFLISGPGGTIQRKDLFDKLHRYPTQYGPANDMYHHLNAACQTPVVLFPFEFVYYRRHHGQEINNKYAYLINNYNYLKDAVVHLPLPLTARQKKWIQDKNNRRFLTNVIRFFLTTFDVNRTMAAIRLTGYRLSDARRGILH